MTSTSATTHSGSLSFEQKLQNYADLTVQVGAGLSSSGPSAGQRVLIQSPVETAPLARAAQGEQPRPTAQEGQQSREVVLTPVQRGEHGRHGHWWISRPNGSGRILRWQSPRPRGCISLSWDTVV